MKKAAFTLVKLPVVIAIVGVLKFASENTGLKLLQAAASRAAGEVFNGF
jgi:Tfp pilus assembly protein PilE